MGFSIPNADTVAYPAMARVYSSDWAIREAGEEGWYTHSNGDIVVATNKGQVKCNAGTEFVGTTELVRSAATDNIACVADSVNTTVASGSNNVHTNTFSGSQTLNVASSASFSGTGGLAWVVQGTTINIIKYTSTGTGTLLNCTLLAGTDITLATGNVVRIANCDETNPKWALIEMNSTGTFSLNLGTAAANPIPPAPTASRVVKAAVYIPALALDVDALTTSSNTYAKIIDKRVIKVAAPRLLMQDASSTTQTNPTTAQSILAAPVTAPANSLQAGDLLIFDIGGQYKNTQNLSDFTITVYIGGAILTLVYAAVPSATNQRYWNIRINVLVFSTILFKVNSFGTISSSATTSATIPMSLPGAGFMYQGAGSTIPDTTIDNDIDVKATIGTPSSSATVGLRQCTVTKFPVRS